MLFDAEQRKEQTINIIEEPENYLWEVNYFLPTGDFIGDSAIVAVPPGMSELAASVFDPSQSYIFVEVEGLRIPENFIEAEYTEDPLML